MLTTKVPFRDSQGNIAGLAGINCYITELKQAREALQTSHQQYRELAENVDDGLAVVQEGNFVFVNAALWSIVGGTPDQGPQMSPKNLLQTPITRTPPENRVNSSRTPSLIPPGTFCILPGKVERSGWKPASTGFTGTGSQQSL